MWPQPEAAVIAARIDEVLGKQATQLIYLIAVSVLRVSCLRAQHLSSMDSVARHRTAERAFPIPPRRSANARTPDRSRHCIAKSSGRQVGHSLHRAVGSEQPGGRTRALNRSTHRTAVVQWVQPLAPCTAASKAHGR
ncbi:hypothetical protein XAC3810_170050 [Xanthomonas citri pv. citri]|uniref:Uncharacterized protein n=1 Tax=Xanthomonas citri pv. citri TaxID=611301 RepID=A0A0U5FB52_XANCI|nr:hypothetical protein XAC3824_140159 [Xanthomonas citri pv. citri]CEE18554.1 hypothetical protein XAC9322_140303 [Xanthomonas citri pv. citri]CEE19583.1 hypothetical protein XAC1083_150163 [Xanthomonas citri pv. citri]CEE27175.1 hypothetical protein XAC2911_130156 [Xanthomonas citri pv. citri]CEE27423.1 hypothetical protein XAC902_170020 [Xanthomonas citri pv. citri]